MMAVYAMRTLSSIHDVVVFATMIPETVLRAVSGIRCSGRWFSFFVLVSMPGGLWTCTLGVPFGFPFGENIFRALYLKSCSINSKSSKESRTSHERFRSKGSGISKSL